MKSFLSFFALLSLLQFAVCTAAARNDIGEYWRAIMKDEAMPEAIRGLVRIDPAASSNEKTNCNDHQTPTAIEIKEEKIILEPRPNRGETKKSFSDDFEPRPNVSAYGNDADLKAEKSSSSSSSSFVNDFEPGPNVSAYGNDADLKAEKSSSSSSSFVDDFEPRPNVSAYGNDADLKAEKPSFTSEFEPGPNVSVYNE